MHAAIYKTFTIAGLALAALPVLAVGMANAQPVRIADLDMSRPAHVQTFNQRVERVADKLCADQVRRGYTALEACKTGVREEAAEKLALVRAGTVTLASR